MFIKGLLFLFEYYDIRHTSILNSWGIWPNGPTNPGTKCVQESSTLRIAQYDRKTRLLDDTKPYMYELSLYNESAGQFCSTYGFVKVGSMLEGSDVAI